MVMQGWMSTAHTAGQRVACPEPAVAFPVCLKCIVPFKVRCLRACLSPWFSGEGSVTSWWPCSKAYYPGCRVLVMEWVDGQSPSQLLSKSAAGGRRSAAARSRILSMVSMGIQCSLSQLLVTGVMHGDPHSGNLLLTPDGRLCYLDFGMLVRWVRYQGTAQSARWLAHHFDSARVVGGSHGVLMMVPWRLASCSGWAMHTGCDQ